MRLIDVNFGGYRKTWIDVLRGLAMLFVLYGHLAASWSEFFVFTSPVKIPLFFAITGYVFNSQNGDIKKFFNNIFIKLCIPWLILSLLPLKIIKALILDHSMVAVGRYIIEFFSGEVLWYMPCCIIAEIIMFFVRKYSKNGKSIILFSIAISVIGYILSKNGIMDLAGFNTACIAQLYILIGWFFREYEDDIMKHDILLSSILAIIYISLGTASLFLYPGEVLDVHTNYYYNLPICIVMILSGCVLMFIFARKFELKSRTVAFIGRNTLVFYMLNAYALKVIYKIFEVTNINLPENQISWLIMVVLICIICTGIAIFINRFMPICVGKKARNYSINRKA